MDSYKKSILGILLKDKRKEYACHIQYVVDIALKIAEKEKLDKDILEVACLLHDIGRGKEMNDESHEQAGRRISADLLKSSPFNKTTQETILNCVLLHNSKSIPDGIYEQSVRTADAGSKIEFHEAFMLMCKKDTYTERQEWALKYLNKGINNISLEWYRKEVEPKYNSLSNIYKRTEKYFES